MTIARRQGRDFGLSADCISKEALKVVGILQKAGYESYIVGGGVRDLLLGVQPKDFDIATSAHPDKIRRLFKRCRLVGKRFKLAHVFYDGHRLEVATFRANHPPIKQKNVSVKDWCLIEDNRYGTLEEDLVRRDFTINAMYYNPFNDQLVCHAHAISDLENRCMRVIGNPQRRYQEDPVRILRGIRLATKLDLSLEQEAEAQIIPNRTMLINVPPARLYEECRKLFSCGALLKVFQQLKRFQLLDLLFPQTAEAIKSHSKAKAFEHFLNLLFSNTDERVALSMPVMPAFVIAGLWWLPVYRAVEKQSRKRLSMTLAWERKTNDIALMQRDRIMMPKYVLNIIHEIYKLQRYFTSRRKRDINFLIRERRFRAAYDFFCLLSEAELTDRDDCRWWKEFQQIGHKHRNAMIDDRVKEHPHRKSSARIKLGA